MQIIYVSPFSSKEGFLLLLSNRQRRIRVEHVVIVKVIRYFTYIAPFHIVTKRNTIIKKKKYIFIVHKQYCKQFRKIISLYMYMNKT